MKRFLAPGIVLFLSLHSLFSQNRIGTGPVAELYQQHCAVCHGDQLQGAIGSNLVDNQWKYGSTTAELASLIRNGLPDMNKPPFEDILSDEQILSLVAYIRERALMAEQEANPGAGRPQDGVYRTQHHAFRLEQVIGQTDDSFWSNSFMPDGRMLLTHFNGGLYLAEDGRLGESIKGIPQTARRGQGGLMEAAAHPDYAENGWIYLAYTDHTENGADGGEGYMTKIVRGRIKDGRWTDNEVIFKVPDRFYTRSGVHYGIRFVFQDGYLFFPIGDRGRQDQAQDLTRPNGKVHRIHDDGRIPVDNPFADREDAFRSVWTYGNRNPQGLDQHPVTGEIWSTEHGPRGGDELNLIEKGTNYGWPVITYGINYNGTPITDRTAAPGMEQPVHYWTPSLAVCGIDFYEGDRFPQWTNDLFVGGLVTERLERFKLKDGKVLEHELILEGAGRVRDLSTGPDGLLYLIFNQSRDGGGTVYRLVPAE